MRRARACGAVGNPGCHLRRLFQRVQVGEVERIRRAAIKRAVRTPAVVELQIAPDTTARRAHRLVGAQVSNRRGQENRQLVQRSLSSFCKDY